MSTEEQEITLIMQRDNLSTSKLRHGREEGPEQSSHVHTQQRGKVVQDEFGSVPADLLTEDDASQLEIGRWPCREVDDGDSVWDNVQKSGLRSFEREKTEIMLCVDSLGVLWSSLTMTIALNSLFAAHLAILPTSNPLPFNRLYTSPPGKTERSSPMNAWVA